MPPLAVHHTEVQGIKPHNRRFSMGDDAGGGGDGVRVLKKPTNEPFAYVTAPSNSTPSSTSEEQPPAPTAAPARGRDGLSRPPPPKERKMERKRSSSLSAMGRYRVRPHEEIPPTGAFASVRAKYLEAAKLTSEKGIYSRAELATVGQIEESRRRASAYVPQRGRGMQRTRSRSLTDMTLRMGRKRTEQENCKKDDEKMDNSVKQENGVQQKVWKKPTAPVQQQVEQEATSANVTEKPDDAKEAAPMKPSWRRASEIVPFVTRKDVEETNRRMSTMAVPASRKKVPQRTRSRSLTEMDQRERGRTWKRADSADQNVPIVGRVKMRMRESWIASADTQQSIKEDIKLVEKTSTTVVEAKEPDPGPSTVGVVTASRLRKVPQRTRSRSLTHLDRKWRGGRSNSTPVVNGNDQKSPVVVKMTRRESWIKPLPTTDQQVQEERPRPTPSVAIKPAAATTTTTRPQVQEETLNQTPSVAPAVKAWRRLSQPMEHSKVEEPKESKPMSSATPTTSQRKVPRRTRSRSLTHLDQRKGGRNPWKRSQEKDVNDDKGSPELVKMALRESWIKPRPKEDGEAKIHNENENSVTASRGRSVTRTEPIQKSRSPLTTTRRSSLQNVPSSWRNQQQSTVVEPTRRPVTRMRSRSLTSMRKVKAEDDGTVAVVRARVDFAIPDEFKALKEQSAIKIQAIARGYNCRIRWITRKPWLQKKQIIRRKEKELIQIERQKNSAILAFKYELDDEETERTKKIKELLKEKASLEKQVQIENETKKAIRADIRKLKEEEERLRERKQTDLVLTRLQSTAATGVHVQQAGLYQRLNAYAEEIDSIRRDLLETQKMWDREKQRKRDISRSMRSIIRAIRDHPSMDEGLVDYLAKYSGLDY